MASETPLPLKDELKEAISAQAQNSLATQASDGRHGDSLGQDQPVTHKKPRDMSPLSWVCVVISLLTSMFLFALDNTIVADVQPSIINTLGGVNKFSWISVGYALGAIALNLFLYGLPT